jgi:hypothetical protein
LTINVQVRHDGAMPVESVKFSEPYPVSAWSKMMDLKTQDVAELGPVVEGVFAALETSSVRLINPLRLLEIGLQTACNHVRAGALLWTTGLDALFAAEKQVSFTARLKSFLGRTLGYFRRIGSAAVLFIPLAMSRPAYSTCGTCWHTERRFCRSTGSLSSFASSPRNWPTLPWKSGHMKRSYMKALYSR